MIRAQTNRELDRRAWYAEIGGNSLAISINYDRTLYKNVNARMGVGFIGGTGRDDYQAGLYPQDIRYRAFGVTVPFTISYLIGKKWKFLEVGAGTTIVSFSYKNTAGRETVFNGVILSGLVGYRRQRPDKGFVFRSVAGPLYLNGYWAPHLGFSFGFVPKSKNR